VTSGAGRILIVDDNQAIHHDFGRILGGGGGRAMRQASLDELERELTGAPAAPQVPLLPAFELCFVHQGADAVRAAADARRADRPFACAFVDIRMPPGIDGIETVAQIWRCQPELEVVLCSAYSDYGWEDLARRLDPGDRLLMLRKPFDPMEVRQLATCLSEKWRRGRQLAERLRSFEAEVEARVVERTRREEAHRWSRRAGALGQLAADIAHEITTPALFARSSLEYLAGVLPLLAEVITVQRTCLAAIASGELTAAQALTRSGGLVVSDALTEAPKALADARSGLARISQVAQRLCSQADLQGPDCLVEVDVNAQVRSALDLVRDEYQPHADAVVELAAVPLVMGDPGDLCLAIVNLIVNAAHAIHDQHLSGGGRGTLTVTTRRANTQVEIVIGDTGSGISPAIRDRVFEPFFTTKPLGQGTGQGLSIAHATIVERHRGSLRFETEPGLGTTFVIGLPAICEAGAP
jgi:signal transduction histidine kinase